MWRLISLCLLLPFILAGCMKNTYHKPDVQVVNKWTVTDRNLSNNNETNTPYLAWWRGFNDPTLNLLIEEGLVITTA